MSFSSHPEGNDNSAVYPTLKELIPAYLERRRADIKKMRFAIRLAAPLNR